MSINDIEAVIPSMSHKILISFEIWLNNRLNTEIIHRKLFKHTITNEQTNKQTGDGDDGRDVGSGSGGGSSGGGDGDSAHVNYKTEITKLTQYIDEKRKKNAEKLHTNTHWKKERANIEWVAAAVAETTAQRPNSLKSLFCWECVYSAHMYRRMYMPMLLFTRNMCMMVYKSFRFHDIYFDAISVS